MDIFERFNEVRYDHTERMLVRRSADYTEIPFAKLTTESNIVGLEGDFIADAINEKIQRRKMELKFQHEHEPYLTVDVINPHKGKGGQVVSITPKGIQVKCRDLGVAVRCEAGRSQMSNLRLIKSMLIELMLHLKFRRR